MLRCFQGVNLDFGGCPPSLFIEKGGEHMSDYEILSIILTFGILIVSVIALSKKK